MGQRTVKFPGPVDPWTLPAEVTELFLRVLEQPESERVAWLESATGDDSLKRRIGELLAAREAAKARLDRLGEGLFEAVAAHARSEPPLVAARAGPYRLTRLLGRGGMSVVYLGTRDDGEFEQTVAVKLMPAWQAGEGMMRRFQAERRILARLEHPGIARLLDGGVTEEGLPFFIMEFVEGEPIDCYCDRRELDTDARLELFHQVFDVVSYAHRNLIVHRDLKPSNILVTPEGRVKLLDFGIAKVLDPENDTADPTVLTRSAGAPMTPAWASPEQIAGEAVSTATDSYTLGVLLYRVLTGRPPYLLQTGSAETLARAIREQAVPAPSVRVRMPADAGKEAPEVLASRRGTTPDRLARRLSGDLDNIVLKALRKEPERRYATVELLAADLRRHRDGLPVAARPDTWRYRAGKFVGRHAWGVAIAILMPALIVAGLLVHSDRLAVERDLAIAAGERNERLVEVLKGTLHMSHPDEGVAPIVTAKDLLASYLAHIKAELDEEPELRLELLKVMGDAHLALNEWHSAREVLKEALSLAQARHAEDQDEILALKALLGKAMAYTGDLERSEQLFAQALEDYRARYGANSEPVAGVWFGMGYALSVNAPPADPRAELAEQALRRALVIYREIQPGPSREQADALNYLARLSDDPQEALTLVEQAYAMTAAVLGEEHLLAARRLADLAMRYDQLGQYQQAYEIGRRALETHSRVAGESHPQSLAMANNQAGFLKELGRYEEALGRYRKSLEIIRLTASPNSMRLAFPLNGIGTTLLEQGRADEAAGYLREVVEITSHNRSPHEPQARRNLARALAESGRVEEARAMYESAIALFESYQGPEAAATERVRAELDRLTP